MTKNPPAAESRDVAFATALSGTRRRIAMSQEALAEAMVAAGFSFHVTTVGKIERGERKVTIGEAAALSEILGVSLNALLGTRDSQLDIAYVVHNREGTTFRQQVVEYAMSMLTVASKADQATTLDEQDKSWLSTELAAQTPTLATIDALMAVETQMPMLGVDPEGTYVAKLLAALRRDEEWVRAQRNLARG